MTIRTFQAGDDVAQVSIYNEAAAALPRFKPATLDEVRRRCRDPLFDPNTHFFAVANDLAVGYATFHANGRLSYPWCRKGHEDQAEGLFQAVLAEMHAAVCRPRSPPTGAIGRPSATSSWLTASSRHAKW